MLSWEQESYSAMSYTSLRTLLAVVAEDLPALGSKMAEIEEERMSAKCAALKAYEQWCEDNPQLVNSPSDEAQYHRYSRAINEVTAKALASLREVSPWSVVLPALLQRMTRNANYKTEGSCAD
jgi:hypothetical protein